MTSPETSPPFFGLALVALWIPLMFSQMRLLLRRYETESSLSSSRAIQAMSFVHALPGHMRSVFYAFHLTAVWLMSESSFNRAPNFSDFESRKDVLQHFSRRETIRIVSTTALVCLGFLCMILEDLAHMLFRSHS